jgi:hypothetical protein
MRIGEMSIYATLWEFKLPKAHRFDTEWVMVYAQAVPAHIGHPSHYPEGDLYADFLPPVVECDPETGSGPYYRAVLILVEGHDEKIGQKYTSPLLTLTGEEYAQISFQTLFDAIEGAMPWDREIVGMKLHRDGTRTLIRAEEWRERKKSFWRLVHSQSKVMDEKELVDDDIRQTWCLGFQRRRWTVSVGGLQYLGNC